jgi:iron(III) transport system ATP-binding protein
VHLELDQLTKRYGDTVSVDGISLSVERGEFICLLGPSGCGKTTTLRMIAGFLEPDRGEIRVEGRTISKPGAVLPPERRNMGMIFQSYAVWPHMTVLQNVAYGLKMKSVAQPGRDEGAMAMLKATQLDGLAHRYPSDLSGGQQQRVALARALAPQPAILLLDEPLSNLDANLRGEMRFEIRRLHDEFSGTSIYVTHDQVEAMTMADRIVVMNAGRIEQIGSPEEVYDRPRSRFVARFIGASNVIEGRRAGDREVDVGGRAIAVAHGDFSAPGEAMSFCVKTHDVELLAAAPGGAGNTLPGTVRSQAYLGSHRDYIVSVGGGQEVLVAAPAAFDVSPGTQVHLRFAAERCRGLIQ